MDDPAKLGIRQHNALFGNQPASNFIQPTAPGDVVTSDDGVSWKSGSVTIPVIGPILEGLDDMGTDVGIVVQDGDATFVKRSITSNDNTVTITNGDGVAGDIDLSIIPVSLTLPVSIAKVASNWLDSYDDSTGLFTQSQPAYTDLTGTPQLPITKGVVASNWLNSYDSVTGLFTQTQPAYSDLTGAPTQPVTIAKVASKWVDSYTSGTGAFTSTQPAYSDLSGTPQLPVTLANAASKWLNSYSSVTGLFTQTQPAYSDLTGTPTLPVTIAAASTKFLTSYTSGTGAFTSAQPAFTDISGTATIAQGGTNNAALSVAAGTIPRGDGSKLLGLALGTKNQILQTNSGATDIEWTTFTALTNPMTKTGDIIYSKDNSGTPERLGIGTNAKLLQPAGGIPAYSAFTFPTAATAGKLVIGDGTNFIVTTPSYPNTAPTAGAFIRGDGTDYVQSTLILPNAAVIGSVPYASAADTISVLAPTANQVIGFNRLATAIEPKLPGFMFDATTTPRVFAQWYLAGISATAITAGLGNATTVTPAGTSSSVITADGQYVNAAVAASTNSDGGVLTTSFISATRQTLPIFWVRVEIGSSIATSRIMIGLESADCRTLSADPTTQSVAMLRYDTGLDTVGAWTTLTCDGASGVTKNSIAASIAVSTKYDICIDLSVSGHVYFWINGVRVADHSTNLPSNTTGLGIIANCRTLANTAKAFRYSAITLTHN